MIFILLILALTVCAAAARRSRKAIAPSVTWLLLALIPPVIGNLILTVSGSRGLSTLGCYIYFLGMDLIMYALLSFALTYCDLSWPGKAVKRCVYLLLGLDFLQLLCNPIFGHAFTTEAIMVDGSPYYRLVPFAGQTFHRAVDYGIFAAVLVVFLIKTVRASRIYAEKYAVILLSMIVGGVWETYYIFSRTPVDRSMVSFAIFGLLVFYFSLFYRPVRLLDRMLANIASELPDALFFFDDANRCVWANTLGDRLAEVQNGNYDAAAGRLEELFGALDWETEVWTSHRSLDGSRERAYYVLERRAMFDAKGQPLGSLLRVRDNTDEQQALQREKYNATHDPLTALYTREYLYVRVHETLMAHPETEYLIVFVDVKDFKIVNDIFGNDFGDFALQRIADWIRSNVSERCVYGRLAGDTFGICVPADEFDPDRIEHDLANFIVERDALQHHVLIHLGVYPVTQADLDVSVMLDRAHLAISTVKEDYQTHIAYYDDAMRDQVLWNQHISSQLQEAMAKRQVVPYLQPMVDRSGKVVGAEALVRWQHPEDGFLSPAAFIPVLEKNGMIAELDKYMWHCAGEILSRWKKQHCNLFISVNISPMDFYFMDVAAELKSVIREFDLDPSLLRIEITETVMMTDIDNRVNILTDLKQSGFLVEMDDFGSGYSSLNLLKDMPVDVIKIDMMFLNQSKNDSKAQTILHNIINLTDDLGISSLTEGVETQTQYQMLTDMGCKLFQGYYFAKPMSVEAFEQTCCTAS